MTVVANLTVKMPRFRIACIKFVIPLIAPFVRDTALGQRLSNAMFAWVQRGLRVSVA